MHRRGPLSFLLVYLLSEFFKQLHGERPDVSRVDANRPRFVPHVLFIPHLQIRYLVATRLEARAFFDLHFTHFFGIHVPGDIFGVNSRAHNKS